MGNAQVGLGHADTIVFVLFLRLNGPELCLGLFAVGNAIGTVNFHGQRFQHFAQGGILRAQERKFMGFLAGLDDFFSQLDSAFAAFQPVFGNGAQGPIGFGDLPHQFHFCIGVRMEVIDGHDGGVPWLS